MVQRFQFCVSTAVDLGLIPGRGTKGFPGGSWVKNPPAIHQTCVLSLCQEDALEQEMATHSSIPAWEIL